MIRKATYLLTVITLAALALLTIRPTAPVTSISRTATTPSLPVCTYEDGSGQALCYWDAQAQGNGQGTDVVSGECAIGSTGIDNEDISALCARVWDIAAYTNEVSDDGATDTWNGPDMVRECTSIEFEAMQDADIRESLNDDEWNMTECLKGMLTENG